MSNTWSSSKFVSCIRKTFDAPPLPDSATFQEWEEYERAAKKHSPLLYYITNILPDILEDIVFWPLNKLDRFSYWISNRFIHKCWSIDTGLDKNTWHESEEKILHGMFEELVEFVEVQLGWQVFSSSKTYGRYKKLPYFIRKLIFLRYAQGGIEHLLWASQLVQDDYYVEKTDPRYGTPTHQALNALEILELYCWWKYIRPVRKDPMDLSGYNAYIDNLSQEKRFSYSSNPEESILSRKCTLIEDQYFTEDTEKMIQLIKIRNTLWT